MSNTVYIVMGNDMGGSLIVGAYYDKSVAEEFAKTCTEYDELFDDETIDIDEHANNHPIGKECYGFEFGYEVIEQVVK